MASYRDEHELKHRKRLPVVAEGAVTFHTGGGIVADSDPASEYRETVNKASAMLKAIEMAEGNS